MKALVLSGGGGKGSYQIGVWKALKKLNIDIDIVTGTSIGALNAALIAQKTYFKAIRLWNNINFNMVFSEKINNEYRTVEGKKELYRIYKKGIYEGGLKTNNLERVIHKNLNVKKIFKSKIKLGIVAFNLSELKIKEIRADEVNGEELINYLIASSSCFPFMKPKEIDNKKYIDGGYCDNLPINLAKQMGATEIIAVDLEAIGIKRPVKEKDNIIYINPSNKLVPLLVFDKYESNKMFLYGYNDTMKKFGKLEGNRFTFKKDTLKSNYNYIKKNYIKNLKLLNSIENKNIIDKYITFSRIGELLKMEDENKNHYINDTIEYIAKIFEMDDSKIYNAKKINNYFFAIITSIKEINIKNLEISELSKTNKKCIIKRLYNLIQSENKEEQLEAIRIGCILKKEFEAALYLSTV